MAEYPISPQWRERLDAPFAEQAGWPPRVPRHHRRRAPIVGLTGYARSGKDTVASILVERYGWTRLAFADALKEIALELDPIVVSDPPARLSTVVGWLGWEGAKRAPEVRRTLQALGVAVRRHLGEDTWVNRLMAELYGRERGVVITDVRFPNEVRAIRDRGGIIVRIVRPGVGPANEHESETGVDDIRPDWRLLNDCPIECLPGVVAAWYAQAIEPYAPKD